MEPTITLPILDDTEIRVLGALIEKSLTTPDYYPMTLNGLTTACNQKSARKPVVEYDEQTVVLALNSLKSRGLIATETGGSNRSAKYRHCLGSFYHLVPAELTVMGLLFLRGPLTPGELKTNAGRMYTYDSLEEVQQLLDELMNGETSYIKQLPKRAGQKEQRYTHLFTDTEEWEEEPGIAEPARKNVSELENRVLTLETELADLKARFEDLLAQLT